MSLTTAAGNGAALASVTVDGTGGVVLVNATSKLKTIDLSGMSALVNTNASGDQVTTAAAASVTYGYQNLSTSTVTLNNAIAETLHLGGADDSITTSSTYAAMDTISGFELVSQALVPGTADAAKSDSIDVEIAGAATTIAFAKTTVTSTSVAGALLEVAAKADDTAAANKGYAFVVGGDTYLFVDGDGNSNTGTANDVLDATDTVIKLTGTLDLDLLVDVVG